MPSDSDSSFDAMLREAAELRVPTMSSPPPEPGELLQKKYLVEEKLGQGGMGAVFRATNVENGKLVAIKWLLGCSPQAALRFAREAHVAAQVDHPNVVNVFDLGTHRGGRYLVMEFLRGQSLGERLREGRLAPKQMVEIMIPVLRGIAAAHAAGIIHRDLKPDNVFLCVGPDGAARGPKLLDFGISKLRTDAPLNDRLTSEGTRLGTPAYMSLEQLIDAPNVDERTDIYAAGVIMYEALMGSLPFRGESYDVLAVAAQKPVPMKVLVPGVPDALERIVTRAMAKGAADRYPDAESLIDALETWLSSAYALPATARSVEEHTAPSEQERSPQARRTAAGLTRWIVAATLVTTCLAAWPFLARKPLEASEAPRALSGKLGGARSFTRAQVAARASAHALDSALRGALQGLPQASRNLMSGSVPAARSAQEAAERAALDGAAPKAIPGARQRVTAARSRVSSPSGPLRLTDL